MTLLRLCFAKRDETLDEGAARLLAYAQRRRVTRCVCPRGHYREEIHARESSAEVEVPADNRPVVAPIYQTVKFEFETRRRDAALAARRAARFLLPAQLQSDHAGSSN